MHRVKAYHITSAYLHPWAPTGRLYRGGTSRRPAQLPILSTKRMSSAPAPPNPPGQNSRKEDPGKLDAAQSIRSSTPPYGKPPRDTTSRESLPNPRLEPREIGRAHNPIGGNRVTSWWTWPSRRDEPRIRARGRGVRLRRGGRRRVASPRACLGGSRLGLLSVCLARAVSSRRLAFFGEEGAQPFCGGIVPGNDS